ncbi:putative succinyl-CoA synthetase-like protein [metagenome]|uniref:Putative succinyl-CoA synthetase-like protein n=1 Tax=metagenome TaxID=256318 RepID=A0A2P2C896_9ZZZZ
MRKNVQRLLAPESFVAIGGRVAEVAIEQSRALGFGGRIWAVHPTRESLAGVACHRSVGDLPEVPDAAFVGVSRERAVAVLGELAGLGVGGAVCHASGFAEDGEEGAALERRLVAAAGDLALVGPNCLGLVSYLDGVALWSDQQGGSRVERGVAIISQSGNIALNLTMQRRSLPIAHVVSVGNCAVTGIPELVEAMLEDPRVTAIGLHLEGIPEVTALAAAARAAASRGVGVVVLKAGGSALGARLTASHTSSLAGADSLADALFERLGFARVHRVETFVETLKLLHVHGPLRAGAGALAGAGPARIATASCSGGEAAHVADLVAARRGDLLLPAFSDETTRRLERELDSRVRVQNPLDYHTYIWSDPSALRSCFAAFLDAGLDLQALLLDVPRDDRCDAAEFDAVLAAFVAAAQGSSTRAAVVSSLPESLPEAVRARLLDAGIAPMQGLDDFLCAVAAARAIGRAEEAAHRSGPPAPPWPATRPTSSVESLDEPSAKAVLAGIGVQVPRSRVVPAHDAATAAAEVGWPVVVKLVSADLLHKSDVGAVVVDLATPVEVRRAVESFAEPGDTVLVEEMIQGVVLELLVGVHRDPQVGVALTVGAGGVLAELLDDVVTVLLPVDREALVDRLATLRCWRLLTGFRGRSVDTGPVLEAIEAVAAYAGSRLDELVELEINPLLVLPDRVVAADAVVRRARPPDEEDR